MSERGWWEDGLDATILGRGTVLYVKIERLKADATELLEALEEAISGLEAFSAGATADTIANARAAISRAKADRQEDEE